MNRKKNNRWWLAGVGFVLAGVILPFYTQAQFIDGGLLGGGGGLAPELAASRPIATEPVSTTTEPAATRPAFVSKDPVFVETSKLFHEGDYKGAMEKLRPLFRNSAVTSPSLESWHLYIATLVAQNQVAQAGYQAVQCLKAHPKTFFTTRPLTETLRDQLDFANQYAAVKAFVKDRATLDPGVLMALYDQYHGAEDLEVVVSLNLLHLKDEDKQWFTTMVDDFQKQIAPVNNTGK